MKFDNLYLEYNEYTKLGGKISKESFNLLEYKAEKKIDELTFNRFRKIEDYPDELKLCVFELIDVISKEDNSNILSESVGSYNVTKLSKKDIEKNKELIIKQCLSQTKIDDVYVLYRGADIDY